MKLLFLMLLLLVSSALLADVARDDNDDPQKGRWILIFMWMMSHTTTFNRALHKKKLKIAIMKYSSFDEERFRASGTSLFVLKRYTSNLWYFQNKENIIRSMRGCLQIMTGFHLVSSVFARCFTRLPA
jgi:hypothetical protein